MPVSKQAVSPFSPAEKQFPLRFYGKEPKNMGIGVSLLLVAAGAILIWAVNATVSGIELQTIGWILLAVGAIGALLSLIFWSSWGGVGGPADGPRGRRTVVRDDY
jgi:uncharacterized protein DUF6458